jgi:hypothetical protein
MPVTVPPRIWWIWSTPSVEGAYNHSLFDHDNVGLMLRIWANATDLVNRGPDFTDFGTSPFEPQGDDPGAYGVVSPVYDPTDPAQTEANCRDAARRVAKRTIDWVRAYIAEFGEKPMSLFLQNWGRTDGNGDDYDNSISLCRFVEDALESYDPLDNNTRFHLQTPFTERARYYMRIWGDEFANFLADNLTEAEAGCIVRMHFDMEEGFGALAYVDDGTPGWLPPLVEGAASAADLARYENEIVDGKHTLKQLWDRDSKALLELCTTNPPGATVAPFASQPMHPYDDTEDRKSYENSVIRDWVDNYLKDAVRAFALDYCLFQPMKKRFPWIQTSEWSVTSSNFGFDECVYDGDMELTSPPVGARAYNTARHQGDHPLDFNCDVFYLSSVHHVDAYSDAMPAGFYSSISPVDETTAFDACMLTWPEFLTRTRTASGDKPFIAWINRPGFERTVTNVAGTAYGTTTLTNTQWSDQCKMLIGDAPGEQGCREILVWDYIPSGTTTDYNNSWTNLESLIDAIKDYGVN